MNLEERVARLEARARLPFGAEDSFDGQAKPHEGRWSDVGAEPTSSTRREGYIWVAGIFEGEGCIQLRQPNNRPRLSVEMTDLDVLLTLQRVTRMGRICAPRKRQEHHKQAWCWQVQKAGDAYALLVAMWPWLHGRRRTKAAQACKAWLGL